jgi:hypothetical protein
MSTKDEIEDYLQGKSLKRIVLSDNVNDIDQGSGTAKEEKIGDKANRLAKAEYVIERDKRMQYGDRQAIAEYATEQTEIRMKLEQQRERQRLQFDLLKEEKARLAIQDKITDLDRENEKEDIEKLERQRDKEIANVFDYFNCSDEFWGKWLNDGHKPEESPANVLIGTGTVGFVCDIHRYKQTIPMPDGRLATSAFTTEAIEDHFRRHDPEMHKQAIISSINEKYDKLIQERKELTLEDPDITLKKEIRQIEKIKTRPPGDWGPGTKITKGERARIRREEEAENEKNRKIYRGLYS